MSWQVWAVIGAACWFAAGYLTAVLFGRIAATQVDPTRRFHLKLYGVCPHGCRDSGGPCYRTHGDCLYG